MRILTWERKGVREKGKQLFHLILIIWAKPKRLRLAHVLLTAG